MRTIGIVTVGRSDYGIYYPILRRLQTEPDLKFYLIVSGAHLSQKYGLTIDAISADGFDIGEKVEMLLSSDSPEAIAKSTGLGVIGFSKVLARHRPDILMVLGDRFEMSAAALAALPFRIPVAHIHGGELSQGAIDDALRHCITKLSHLHFVSTKAYARRVIQLGEEPWRVKVTGAPALDLLDTLPLFNEVELQNKFGIMMPESLLMVTYHPVTLQYEQTEWQVQELLAAIDACCMPALFTLPNADTHNQVIRKLIYDYARQRSSVQVVENLGSQAYFSLMARVAAMVGNSSSGMIEAASFDLPVVNVGIRQQGRAHGTNVIHTNNQRDDIVAAIRKAVSPKFRHSIKDCKNPYHHGNAADLIVHTLKEISIDERLLIKKFFDIPEAAQ